MTAAPRRYDRPKLPLVHFTLAARATLCGQDVGGGTPPPRGKVCRRCRWLASDRLTYFQRALGARS